MVIVPEIALVVAALFAAMLVYAVVIVAKGFAGLFPTDIPILSTIHRLFYNIALVGGAAASWIMSDVIRPLINAIVGPVLSFVRMLEGLVSFAGNVATSWVWLLNTAIPRVISLVTATALSAVRAAERYAVSLVHSLAAAVLHDIALARAYSVALVHSLAAAVLHDLDLVKLYSVALVHNLAAAVTKDISLVYSRAIAYAKAGDAALGRAIHAVDLRVSAITTGILSTIRTEVATGVRAAEQFTVAETANAIHLVDVDTAVAFGAVADGLIIDIGKLADVIGTDLPDIGAAVRAIPRAVPTDLTDTIAMVGALAVPVIRYMRECGVPNCRNLSKYGRDLAALSDLVGAGALVAMLAELVADPEGAARELESIVGGTITGAVSAARDLLGAA